MAKNYFNRYVWLIDTISRHGHITFPELSGKWERSALNEDGAPLAERTFHNHRQAVEDIFGIEIRCDRSLGYYIANSGDLKEGGIRQWLLESLSLSNLLNESRDLRDRILFERIPSGKQWLPAVVNAMRDGKAMEMTYQSFSNETPSSFTAHPWCLKVFQRRWYMLALSEGYEHPRIYSLDRILDLRESRARLRKKKGFDAAAFFHNSFGIYVEEGRKPENVDIKVDASQVKYLESLPLHDSQEKISQCPDHAIFRFRLVPTYDFEQEILRHGPSMEVLSPQWLRAEIMDLVAGMASRYGL